LRLGTFRFYRQQVQSGILPIGNVLRVVVQRPENIAMDKDRIVGSAKQAKGAVKETIGKAMGDAKLQADGKRDKARGKLQNVVGGVKDALRTASTK
jgi:uncharacterized protein YjbJ (UPF0337 family)